MKFSIFNFSRPAGSRTAGQFSKISIYLSLLLLAIGLFTRPCSAADLKTATTQIDQSREQLLDVKDDTVLSPEDKLQKEIAARVNIVTDALSLSLQEISNLEYSMSKLPQFAANSREDALSRGFMADLKTFRDYYTAKEAEISKATFTLDDIKNFAKTIIDYRDTVYNPKVAGVVDFTLLFYNEDALAIAKTRLVKISADIKKLEKLGIIKTDYFKTGIDKISDLLKDSGALNLKARTIILADDSDAKTEIINPAEPLQPTPTELLINSLGNIKSAYEIFVQIGKDTKKILEVR